MDIHLATYFNPKRVRKIGFILFALSFVTPELNLKCFGLGAFLSAPAMVWGMSVDGEVLHDWHITVLVLATSIGWLSNFTIFFRLPRLIVYVSIMAPWLLFVAMIFLLNSPGCCLEVLSFIPFYPWAVGIALVHLSRLKNKVEA